MSNHLIATSADCDWRYGLRWASIADPLAKHSKIKPMTTAKKPLIVLYRWRLHPGSEAGFIVAWSRLTERLKECGSLGSRLHRGPDDILYGYAQWPSDEVRLAAFAENLDPDAAEQMSAAIAERFPEIQLEPVVDYLEPLASRAGAIQMAHCRCPRTMAACSVRAYGTRKPDGLSGPRPPKRRPRESRCPRRRTSDVPGSSAT